MGLLPPLWIRRPSGSWSRSITQSAHGSDSTEIPETASGRHFRNLGCGLDTTFERVDNGLLQWYDLDLPDAVELRKGTFESDALHIMSMVHLRLGVRPAW